MQLFIRVNDAATTTEQYSIFFRHKTLHADFSSTYFNIYGFVRFTVK
jgi:hypothetical protein